MKKVYAFVLVELFLTLNLFAQWKDSQLGIGIGGGLHTLLYSPADGERKNGYGGKVGLDYSYFFNQYIGLGTGLYLNFYKAQYKLNANLLDDSLYIDEDNYNYTFSYHRSVDMKEIQKMYLLEIPVKVYGRLKVGNACCLLGAVGVAFELPIHAVYSASGSRDVRAYYPDLNIEFYNMPNHGLYYGTYEEEENLVIRKTGVSLIADLGISTHWNNRWSLYVGAYLSYGLLDYMKKDGTSFYSIENEFRCQNALSSDITKKMNLFSAGLKVGLSCSLYKKKKEMEQSVDLPFIVDTLQKDTLQNILKDNIGIVSTQKGIISEEKAIDKDLDSVKSIKYFSEADIKKDSVVRSFSSINENQNRVDSVKQKIVSTNVNKVVRTGTDKKQKRKPASLDLSVNGVRHKDVGDFTVRKKWITLLCTNGTKVSLLFYEPGSEKLNPIIQSQLMSIANELKGKSKEKIIFIGENQNKGSNKRVLRKDRSLLLKIRKLLIEYGVLSDQIIIGVGK